jgi:glycosyltransferase involved in cell wall biosynthesis
MDIGELRRIEFSRRHLRLQDYKPMKIIKTDRKKNRLHIVYVMTWVGICGGSKIILQHCNRLVELGHKATIVCQFAKPGWFPLDERVAYVHAPMCEVLCEYIPRCDVIVATYWKEIYECVEQRIAPVVYFEQGDNHLFSPEAINAATMEHIQRQIQSPPFVFTVSTHARAKLKESFNVEATVIPNAIDKSIFYPKIKGGGGDGKTTVTITAIGSENVYFKCIPEIFAAIEILRKIGREIEFVWITPDMPNVLPRESAVVNPEQKVIGDCLRRSDIFICASLFESFCLPALEAMTCGAAVVTTDNGGVGDFAKDNENALMIEKNNIADMVCKLDLLINNPELRHKLMERGLETSKRFSWDVTMDRLIEYYYDIAGYDVLD